MSFSPPTKQYCWGVHSSSACLRPPSRGSGSLMAYKATTYTLALKCHMFSYANKLRLNDTVQLLYSSAEQVVRELQSVIKKAMWDHTLLPTCHPTQVNTSSLNPSHTGWSSIYLPRRDRRLSWLGDIPRGFNHQCTNLAAHGRVKLVTCWLQAVQDATIPSHILDIQGIV